MADNVAMMEVCKEHLVDSMVQIVCWHILRGNFGEIRLSEGARLQLCNILRGMCSSLSGPGDLSVEGLKLVKLVTLTEKLEREPNLAILPVLVNVLQSLQRFQEFKGFERHTKEAKCQVILECYRVKNMDAGVRFWEKYFGDENEPLAKELSVIVEGIGKVSGADISRVVVKFVQSHPYGKFRDDVNQQLAAIFPNLTEPHIYTIMREDVVSIRTRGVYRHTALAKNLPQFLLQLKEEPMSEGLVGSEGGHNLGEDREMDGERDGQGDMDGGVSKETEDGDMDGSGPKETEEGDMDGGGPKEREGQGDMPPLSDTESVMEEEEMQVERPEESEGDGGCVIEEHPEGDGGCVLEERPEGDGHVVLEERPEGDRGVVLGDTGVHAGSGIEGEANDDRLPVTTNSLSPLAGMTRSPLAGMTRSPVLRLTRSPVPKMTRSLVPVAETTKSVVDTTTPGPSGVIYSHGDEDDALFCYENTRRKRRLLQVENTTEGDQIEWASSSSDESEVHTPPSKIPSGPKIVIKRRESLLGKTRKHVKEKKDYPRRRPWDAEEAANLIKGVKQFGTGNWIKIRQHYHFNNRSNVDLKDKWRNLSKQMTT